MMNKTVFITAENMTPSVDDAELQFFNKIPRLITVPIRHLHNTFENTNTAGKIGIGAGLLMFSPLVGGGFALIAQDTLRFTQDVKDRKKIYDEEAKKSQEQYERLLEELNNRRSN